MQERDNIEIGRSWLTAEHREYYIWRYEEYYEVLGGPLRSARCGVEQAWVFGAAWEKSVSHSIGGGVHGGIQGSVLGWQVLVGADVNYVYTGGRTDSHYVEQSFTQPATPFKKYADIPVTPKYGVTKERRKIVMRNGVVTDMPVSLTTLANVYLGSVNFVRCEADCCPDDEKDLSEPKGPGMPTPY
jgi:hypothetical protein